MRDKKRKKLQKEVNKVIKSMNFAIKNDPLWKGRYYAKQINAVFKNFYDGSGIEMKFVLRFIDRKTSKNKDFYFDTFTGGVRFLHWELFDTMNNFIINSGVWNENPRPTYDNTPDYRRASL